MNFTRLGYVTERAEIGEHREAILAVTIPERPGAFLEFCRTIGERSVTEFNYRLATRSEAHIFVGLEVTGRARGGGDRRDARARTAMRVRRPRRRRPREDPRPSHGRRPEPGREATRCSTASSSRSGRAPSCSSSPASGAAGTSRSSTTATTAPRTAACSAASRCRPPSVRPRGGARGARLPCSDETDNPAGRFFLR